MTVSYFVSDISTASFSCVVKFMMAVKDFGPGDSVVSAVGVLVCQLAFKSLSSWTPAEGCDRVIFVFWSSSCYLELKVHRDVTPALITGKLSACSL